ncbi:helix-turn-helix transcriptional regulator [Nocardia callitridis]|uniref:Helix-turn-helix transcriptional regulator n=1 Tax=Nocardia callitridis TaxID=648753 RepID=A0ABP9JWI5_9NOCA
MTIAEASRLMEWGASTLQRLEKGQADRIRTIDIQELCRIYGIPAELADGLKGLAQQVPAMSWWHSYDSGGGIPANFDVYSGLEASAQRIASYQSEALGGLLQTTEYAMAVNRLGYPDDSEAQLERRVGLRMQRQVMLTKKVSPVLLDVVLHESVLRRVVGGAKVMSAQLRHLADFGTRDNVSLRILPFAAGVPLGVSTGPFTVLEFGTDSKGHPIEPSVVYAEGLSGELYLERRTDVRRYDRAHESLRDCALDAQASRQLLRAVAKEFITQ